MRLFSCLGRKLLGGAVVCSDTVSLLLQADACGAGANHLAEAVLWWAFNSLSVALPGSDGIQCLLVLQSTPWPALQHPKVSLSLL